MLRADEYYWDNLWGGIKKCGYAFACRSGCEHLLTFSSHGYLNFFNTVGFVRFIYLHIQQNQFVSYKFMRFTEYLCEILADKFM